MIRVTSNTPQQKEASAESFGYIRAYRSPLEGVQAADVGRGYKEAGQAVQRVAMHMQQKADEAGKLAASKAYDEYDAKIKLVNAQIKSAFELGDKEKATEFMGQFNDLNPRNKDFTLGTEVDQKYYEPYLAGLATDWERHNIAHTNAKNQYTIVNDLTDSVNNNTNNVASFPVTIGCRFFRTK